MDPRIPTLLQVLCWGQVSPGLGLLADFVSLELLLQGSSRSRGWLWRINYCNSAPGHSKEFSHSLNVLQHWGAFHGQEKSCKVWVQK